MAGQIRQKEEKLFEGASEFMKRNTSCDYCAKWCFNIHVRNPHGEQILPAENAVGTVPLGGAGTTAGYHLIKLNIHSARLFFLPNSNSDRVKKHSAGVAEIFCRKTIA